MFKEQWPPQSRTRQFISRMAIVFFTLLIFSPFLLYSFCMGVSRAPQAAKAEMADLSGQIHQFRLDCGRYPSSDEGFNALFSSPASLRKLWKGPYRAEKIPTDPWGNAYVYVEIGKNEFEITSYGSDGKPGGVGEAADIIDAE